MSRVQEYRRAMDRLAAAQKPGEGVPPYTRYMNRPMGRRLAAVSFAVGLTPDQVTGLSMLSSGLGLALLVLVPPSPGLGLVVGFLMVLGYALDSADGQLARVRGGGGPAGEWLDHVSDQARQGAMHACVLVYLYRFLPQSPQGLLVVPLIYGVTTSTRFLSQILAEQMRRQWESGGSGGSTPQPIDAREATRIRLRAWGHLPADMGVLCLAFALSGIPALFLLVYALLAALNTVSAAVSLARKRVELRAMSVGPSRRVAETRSDRAAPATRPSLGGGGRPREQSSVDTSDEAPRPARSRHTTRRR